MEKLITNLQQTYCTRNSYYMMSIINQFREKAPDLCINYLFEEWALIGARSQFRKLGILDLLVSNVGFYYKPAIKTTQWYSRPL